MKRSKIQGLVYFVQLRKRLKQHKKKLVFTNGCFDVLHFGHASYLAKARRLGDYLIVGLNTDGSIRRLKGPGRPVFHQRDRARMLAALECVDGVVLFDDETPIRLIRALRPDILVKGADWPARHIVGYDLVRSYGGQVRRLPLERGRSTSRIVQKLTEL